MVTYFVSTTGLGRKEICRNVRRDSNVAGHMSGVEESKFYGGWHTFSAFTAHSAARSHVAACLASCVVTRKPFIERRNSETVNRAP